jgi:hypothetical protein
MSDRLTLTRALESSGMQTAVAERTATEIYYAIDDNVATKTDLRDLDQRLELRFAALDVRFEKLERQMDRMVARVGAFAVVLLTLLFGALHLWPPR